MIGFRFHWISFLSFFVAVGLFQARSSITVVESLRNPPPANLASGADDQVTESCGFFFLNLYLVLPSFSLSRFRFGIEFLVCLAIYLG